MKKSLSVFIATAILFSVYFIGMFNINASAATSGYYTYTVSNGEAIITDCYDGISGEITIPSSLGGYSVTGICDNAFFGCRSLTSIIIPDSITSIDNSAFWGCTSLENILIGSSVKSIKENTFLDCTSLKNIVIPDSVINIEKSAFYNCKSLISIIIPDSVTSIVESAFSQCTSLTNISLPNNLKGINNGAFGGCTSLKNIVIPDSVTSIDNATFHGCTSLEKITIGNSVVNIGYGAFDYCNNLKNVFYRGDKSQKNNINFNFNDCLINASWYYNTCIDSATHFFDNECDKYCNICDEKRAVPDHIYDNVCDTNCNVCSEIRIVPDHAYTNTCDTSCNVCGMERTITHTYDNACDTTCNVCYDIRKITHNYEWVIDKEENCGTDGYKHEECTVCYQIQNENTVIEATGVHTYASNCDLKCEVCVFERSVSEEHSFKNRYDVECDLCGFVRYLTYEIENDCVTIFKCDTNFIGKMEIPYTIEGCVVKYIADNAFEDCKYLTAVKMPDTVLEIGDYAFSSCTSLVEVAFSQAIEKIGEYAFLNCITINEIIVPDNVKTLGFAAFGGCENLSKITLPFVGETIEETENDYFAYIFGAESIINYRCVPSSLSEVIITKAEIIEAYAFYNCNYILRITLPSSLKYIGESAFEFCKIKGVYISDIDNWFGIEFKNNTSNPMWYSGLLFLNGELYTNHKILKDTLVIEQSKYCNYKCIKNLYIPKSVELIMEGAFLDCNSLGYIFYEGTKEQWNEIVIVTGNDFIKFATVFYNCDDIYECYISGHSGGVATCKKKAKCSCCGQEYGNLASHSYISATCTKAKTCKVCGNTSGSTLEHKYSNKCDTICNVCGNMRKILHTYKTATTKATLTQNGKVVKKCTICGDIASNKTIYYPKTIKLLSSSYTYNGSAKKPTVTVKGYDGKTISSSNYTVTYKNNKNAGTATATVTFKGNYSGTKTLTYKINPASTSKAAYKLSNTSYTYNGKAKTPTVTVKLSGKTLKKNTDYTVKYSNNKSVGKATVNITFKGNYKGTKTLIFKINPVGTTVKSLTAGKKSLKVAITKKSTQITGYQIQYATNKSFKSAKTKNVTSYKTTSATLKGLTAKKTYYVRVRTYKTVKGVKYYSGWSKIKYKKTK